MVNDNEPAPIFLTAAVCREAYERTLRRTDQGRIARKGDLARERQEYFYGGFPLVDVLAYSRKLKQNKTQFKFVTSKRPSYIRGIRKFLTQTTKETHTGTL